MKGERERERERESVCEGGERERESEGRESLRGRNNAINQM